MSGFDTKAPQEHWSVWRQDDNGNQYLVKSDLTREEAEELVRILESHGHKQMYWVSKEPVST